MKFSQLRSLLLKRFRLPKERAIGSAIRSFSVAEKAVYFFFATIFIISGLILLWKVNVAFLREVPARGGSLVEGLVGNPRFINPVLALSEADKNMSALVYSGLVRFDEHGELRNDLAESVVISEDGLSYTASLREGVLFHDGMPISADDIVYTVGKVIDPLTKSPRRGNWEGVRVEKLDERTVVFNLSKPYAPFMENLTLGILPRHIWRNVSDDEFSFSQFNTLPIGSGPYRVARVERNQGGIPNYYELESFRNNYASPYINKLVFKFYSSEANLFSAYGKGEIESLSGISPEDAKELEAEGANIVSSPLFRIFGVFFNANKNKVLLEKDVRKALDLSAPKEAIVTEVLGGYAVPIDGPLPSGIFSWSGRRASTDEPEARFAAAEALLAKAGWKKNTETGVLEKTSGKSTIELSFSISTGDASELQSVAEKLREAWTRLGAKVEVIVFETGDLNQNVIRPRAYDALLFGEVVGRDADVYPFWHSSQRNDPGLNIALYANARADKFLEAARSTTDLALREKNYKSFQDEVIADVPAVFLYSPSFLYVVPEKVNALELGGLSTPQDRFLGVRDWYIETDKVWEIFINQNS